MIIICKRVRNLLNEALLKGFTSISLDTLSNTEEEELLECGYEVKKVDNKYIVSQ